jgi:hypothetical protein
VIFVTLRQRLQVFLAGHNDLAWVSVTLSRSFMQCVGNHRCNKKTFFFGLGSAADRAEQQDKVARALFANMTYNWA